MCSYAGHGENEQDSSVHNQLCNRIQKNRDFCNPHGGSCELIQLAGEAVIFLLCFTEGADHADAGHILADNT